MGEFRKICYKPGDEDNTYMMLTSDGRIIVRGSVVDPDIDLNFDTGSRANIARDLQVIDWVTPSGYILNGWGGIHTFGSVTAPPSGGAYGSTPWQQGWDLHRAFVMNPAGNGQGYMLRADGLIERFGATLPPSVNSVTSGHFPNGSAIHFVMDWTTKRYYVLAATGELYPMNGAEDIENYTSPAVVRAQDGVWRYARAVEVADWDDGVGYVMDIYGILRSFTGPGVGIVAKDPARLPNWKSSGQSVARDLLIQEYSPFHYRILTNNGQLHEIWATDAPVIDVTAPTAASTITTTRKPTISWTYSDDENDHPSRYYIRIFLTSATTAPGFDPFVNTPLYYKVIDDYRVTEWEVEEDLTNGSYTAYVRAREENSGLLSNVDSVQWTQNVTLQAGPTMTSYADAPCRLIIHTAWRNGTGYTTPFIELQADAGGGDWWDVLRGDQPTLTGSPPAGDFIFLEAQQGGNQYFRCRVVNGGDTSVYSEWTYFYGADLQTHKTWISSPLMDDNSYVVRVAELTYSLPTDSAAFSPIGERLAIPVIGENSVKGRVGSMRIQVLSFSDLESVKHILTSDEVLLLRDQFGKNMYFTRSGGLDIVPIKAAPAVGETTSVRYAFDLTVPFSEVEPPQ